MSRISPVREMMGDATQEVATVTQAARAVLKRPDVLDELFRLMAYLEPEQLQEMKRRIEQAEQNRVNVLAACANATFGRDYIADGEEGDVTRLSISEGNSLANAGTSLGKSRQALIEARAARK